MHSDLDQDKREDVILDFKSGKINVLIATDIMSRGIDIDDIELVVNYDVPREAEDYVHRIGRTARADRNGKAITFISEKEIGKFKRIEKMLEKSVEKAKLPDELGEGPSYNNRDKAKRNASDSDSGNRKNYKKKRTFHRKSKGNKPSSIVDKKDNYTSQQ